MRARARAVWAELHGGCQIVDFRLEDALATPLRVGRIHTKLFAIESFDQIYEAMHQAERQLGALR